MTIVNWIHQGSVLSFLLLLLLGGCATQKQQPDDSLANYQLVSAPDAWLLDNTLVVRFQPHEG